MTRLKARIWAALAALGAILGAVAAIYGKGSRDANTKRDADDMKDAYQREVTRNEIERDSATGDARERLRKDWQRRD